MATRNAVPRANGEGQIGTSVKQWQQGHFQQLYKSGQEVATLASPALTGNPTAPTQAGSDDSTRIATTAFVQALIGDLLSSSDIFIRKVSASETEWLSNAQFSGGGYLSLAAGYCWRLSFSSGNVRFQYYNAAGAGEGITWSDVNFRASSLELLGTSVLTIVESAGLTQFRTALGLGTSALLNVPASGNAAVGDVVKGDDTRLTDSRTCDNTFDNAATARTNLGLTIGTNVQAYDVILAYLSALTAASGKMIYFDSNTTVALADITSHGRDLIASANAAASRSVLGIAAGIASGNYLTVDAAAGAPADDEYARFTANGLEGRTVAELRADIGLVIGTNVQAWSAILDAMAGVTGAADKIAYFTSASTMAVADFTATGRSLVGAASLTAIKQLLDLEIAVDVQAYSALLTAIAALTPTDGNVIVGNGTTWVTESGATARTSLDVSRAGFSKGYREVSANSTITNLDETIVVTGESGNVVLTIESESNDEIGKRLLIKKSDDNAFTVTLQTEALAKSYDVIGNTSFVLSSQGDFVEVELTGDNVLIPNRVINSRVASEFLQTANNLSEIASAGVVAKKAAVENLGLGQVRLRSDGGFEILSGAEWIDSASEYRGLTGFTKATRLIVRGDPDGGSDDSLFSFSQAKDGNFAVGATTVFAAGILSIDTTETSLQSRPLAECGKISFTGTGAADTTANLNKITRLASSTTLTAGGNYRYMASGLTTDLMAAPQDGETVQFINYSGGTNTIDGNGKNIRSGSGAASATVSILNNEVLKFIFETTGDEWLLVT